MTNFMGDTEGIDGPLSLTDNPEEIGPTRSIDHFVITSWRMRPIVAL